MIRSDSGISQIDISGDTLGGEGTSRIELSVDPIGTHDNVIAGLDRDIGCFDHSLLNEQLDRIIIAIEPNLDNVVSVHISKADDAFQTWSGEEPVIITQE